ISSNVHETRELFWAISSADTATPPALTALAGPNGMFAARNVSMASCVDGMFAPSATALTPLLINRAAPCSSSSFSVAHGMAISHGTDQISVHVSLYCADGW